MILSMLIILRDQGISLPAGAILISPWVDLCHSFPSLVQGECGIQMSGNRVTHRDARLVLKFLFSYSYSTCVNRRL